MGTNFVNCVANAKNTLCIGANLNLIAQNGSQLLEPILGDIKYKIKQDGVTFNNKFKVYLGNLQ